MLVAETKKCNICKEQVELSSFTKKKKFYRECCNPCRAVKLKDQYNNDEVYRERTRFINWKSKIKRKYKMTPEDYYIMLDEQKGVCAICKSSNPKTKNNSDKFCIDHNHITNEIRGLLCSECNSALGQFRDDPNILMSAYEYLNDKGNYKEHSKFSDLGTDMKIGKKKR
jgi:hypothetical protein